MLLSQGMSSRLNLGRVKPVANYRSESRRPASESGLLGCATLTFPLAPDNRRSLWAEPRGQSAISETGADADQGRHGRGVRLVSNECEHVAEFGLWLEREFDRRRFEATGNRLGDRDSHSGVGIELQPHVVGDTA